MKQSEIIKLASKLLTGYKTKSIAVKNNYAFVFADDIILKVKCEDISTGDYIILDKKLKRLDVESKDVSIKDDYNFYLITEFSPQFFKRLKNCVTSRKLSFVYNKLNFVIYNNDLCILGSDGYRLLFKNLGRNGKLPEQYNEVVKAERLLKVLPFIKGVNELKLYLGKKSLLFRLGEVEIVVRYDNNVYPDTFQFLRLSIKKAYVVEYKDIKNAISHFIEYFKSLPKTVLTYAIKIDFDNSKLIFHEKKYKMEQPIKIFPYDCPPISSMKEFEIVMPVCEEEDPKGHYIEFNHLKDIVLKGYKKDFIIGLLNYKNAIPYIFSQK